MKKNVSAVIAIIGPMLLLMVLSRITYHLEATTDITTAPLSLIFWYLVWGVLTGLYLVLTVLTLPKHTSSALVPCAIIGAVLVIVLCVLELSVFGVWGDYFPFHIVLPFRMETLFIVPLMGLLVVGNLACAVLAKRGCAGTE